MSQLGKGGHFAFILTKPIKNMLLSFGWLENEEIDLGGY